MIYAVCERTLTKRSSQTLAKRRKLQGCISAAFLIVLLTSGFPLHAHANAISACLSAAASPLIDPGAKPVAVMTGTRADLLALQETCESARHDAPTNEAVLLALSRVLYRRGDALGALAMLDETAGGEASMITRAAIIAVAKIMAENGHGSSGLAFGLDFALRANGTDTKSVTWSSQRKLSDYKALLSLVAIHRYQRGIATSDYKEMSDRAKKLDDELWELALLAKDGSALATELLGYEVAESANTQMLPRWPDIKAILNGSVQNGAGGAGEAWLGCASQFWKALEYDRSVEYSPSQSTTSGVTLDPLEVAENRSVLVPYYGIARRLDEEFAKTQPFATDRSLLAAHVTALRNLAEEGNPYAQTYLAYSAAGTLIAEIGDHLGWATVPCGFRVALVFQSDSEAVQYLVERSDAGDCAALANLLHVYRSGGRRLNADQSKLLELQRKGIMIYCPRNLMFYFHENGEIFAIENVF